MNLDLFQKEISHSSFSPPPPTRSRGYDAEGVGMGVGFAERGPAHLAHSPTTNVLIKGPT